MMFILCGLMQCVDNSIFCFQTQGLKDGIIFIVCEIVVVQQFIVVMSLYTFWLLYCTHDNITIKSKSTSN